MNLHYRRDGQDMRQFNKRDEKAYAKEMKREQKQERKEQPRKK